MSNFKGILNEMWNEYQIGHYAEYVVQPREHQLIGMLIQDYSPYWFTNYKFIESYSDEIGELCYSVFTWKDKYYRIPYSHRSHEGSDYWGNGSDIQEVKPVVKEVRVWE